eukprot:g4159.t1
MPSTTRGMRHLTVAIATSMLCFLSTVGAIKLRQAPPEPPPIPAQAGDQKGGSVKSEEYIIPQYPEPPVPALSPPSTMPFAIFDQEHSNAFEPPEQTVKSANKLVEQAEERKRQGQSPLEFQEPPLLEMSGPSGPAFRNRHTLHGEDNFLLRKDSANPYCEFCKATVVKLTTNPNFDEKQVCELFPFSSHKACHKVVKSLSSVPELKEIGNTGCVDRTSGMARIRKTCPPLVACNIIATKAGIPMCGTVMKGWGNLVKDTTANNNPPYAPPPGLGSITGSTNKYCDLCTSIMSVLSVDSKMSEQKVCDVAVPASLQEPCLYVQGPLKQNEVFKQVMADGCIDTTDVTGPLKQKFCSPYIACNLIGDASGSVMCGTQTGIYGKLDSKK